MDILTNAIFGGFISKVINDITDVSDIKNKIINAVKNKENRHQMMESQIYNIIVDALNKFTYNEYEKNQDRIFNVAEVLFKGFKVGEDEAIRLCFQDLNLDNNENEIQRFKVVLCETLGKTEYRELYCAILLLILTKRNQLDVTIVEKLDEILKKSNNKDSNNEEDRFKNKIKSRTQDYLDIWNKNMFLNDFTEWDENKSVNIKLSDVYIKDCLPHFSYGENPKEYNNIDVLLSQYVSQDSDDNKMLLILGQPGIGKSTLITWILNNFKDRVDDIMVYQFASDLKDVPWGNFISTKILVDKLESSYEDLTNKVLILDGFDEIDVERNRKSILDIIYEDLIYKKTVKNFTLIITCRENYIEDFERVKCKYIILQPWNEKQIKSFCKVYCDKNRCTISYNNIRNVIFNKEILGIPLILYMVLALKINVENETSIISVYDKIFSLNGGIYDRCIDNKNFAEQHRIGEIKRQIHQVSREIAFWMFENNSEKAYIPQHEYQSICKKVADESGNKSLEQDFIIGNFYKLKHYEGIGTNELYFVHRTIYEYFVVDYLFSSICENIESSKQLANIFGYFLKKERLSETICEFLKYKIQSSILKNKDSIIIDTFNLMLKDGMTYYTGLCYKNVIECEMRIFANMLEILHLWNNKCLKIDESISTYLSYNKYVGLNLENIIIQSKIYVNNKTDGLCSMPFSGIYLQEAHMAGIQLQHIGLSMANLMLVDLEGANLEGVDLKGANLSITNLTKANLTKAVLEQADLSNANLSGAILKEAMLIKADLTDIDLTEADLTEAILDEQQIIGLENKYDLSKASVYLKAEKIISYKEYKETKGE